MESIKYTLHQHPSTVTLPVLASNLHKEHGLRQSFTLNRGLSSYWTLPRTQQEGLS